MAHDHSHDENYFLEQIFSIGICATIGVIAVLLYTVRTDILGLMLVPLFHPYVLAGGIVLLIASVVRGVAVWREAGHRAHVHAHHHHEHDHGHDHTHDHHHEHDHGHDHHHDHDHDHAHGHGHDHSHDHDHEHSHDHAHAHHHHHEHDPGHAHDHSHDHDHDHEHHHHEHEHAHGDGHEHSWAPWRYTILMVPVVLFCLGLPKDTQSARPTRQVLADDVAERLVMNPTPVLGTSASATPLASAVFMAARQGRYSGGVVTRADKNSTEFIEDISFARLELASSDAEDRRKYEGKPVTIIGKFAATSDPRQFGLVRLQRACCAADAIPLNAILQVDPNWAGAPLNARAREQKWVRVTGRIFFKPARGGQKPFVTAVIVYPGEEKDESTQKKIEYTPDDLVQVIDPPANPYLD